MTTKLDFTEDEVFLLTTAPSLVGSAVAMAGKSGAIGMAKEMMAQVQGIAAGANTYPDNELIASLLEKPATREESKEKAKDYQQRAVEDMKAAGVQSPDQLADKAIADVERTLMLLGEKATEVEAADFKAWLLDVANKVAAAAKEGGMFGIGGETVSEAETAFISRLEAVLGGSDSSVDSGFFNGNG